MLFTHNQNINIYITVYIGPAYFNAGEPNINLSGLMKREQNDDEIFFTEREKTFLQLACSDLTYREIAVKMYLAERTIDGYRESLFAKMNVQSRVGMVLRR